MAIKKTQFDTGNKLKAKYFGPYRISRVKGNDIYEVEKEGFHYGPIRTSTCAEFIKPLRDPLSPGPSEADDN